METKVANSEKTVHSMQSIKLTLIKYAVAGIIAGAIIGWLYGG